jgi:hypothetical protein
MDTITASEMLEEFRLMEGTLFQDEEAKLFYLDVKGVVLDSLVAAWDKFSASDVLFQTALDRYYAWEGAVGHEEVERCMSDVNNVCERHFHVAVFYSRQLYGNEDFNQKIVIAKPKIEVLLKTLFRRLVRNLHVKSGAFFSFDPMKQDFIVRDAFRQALAESIKVVDIATNTKKVVSVSENDDDQALKEKNEETLSTHSTVSKREKRNNEEREREEKEREREREQRENEESENKEREREEKEREQEQERMKLEEEKLEQEQERVKQELYKQEDKEEQQKQKENEKDHIQEQEQEQEQNQKQEIAFDVKKVDEDYNVGDSISVFLDHDQGQNNQNQKEKEETRRSVLKIPTLVRTVFLS